MPPLPRLATIADLDRDRIAAARHLRLVVPRAVRVVIADDLALHRAGLRALLEGEDDIVVIGEAGRGDEASTLSRDLRPDVLVLDLGGAPLQVLETAWQIVTDPDLAGVGVLILTPPDPGGGVPAGREGGACRFLVKDSDPTDLVAAVRGLASRPRRPRAQHLSVVRIHHNQGAA
jgi:DNA-binding NarL/FixJ family response regulator